MIIVTCAHWSEKESEAIQIFPNEFCGSGGTSRKVWSLKRFDQLYCCSTSRRPCRVELTQSGFTSV